MNREPSNFWFLIPVIAGGFALVLLGALTPIISIIYGVPCAVIAAGLGYRIFPNLMMMVLLYGGDLAVVLEPVSMFMLHDLDSRNSNYNDSTELGCTAH